MENLAKTYNLDELEAPAWLNDEFFCNVMRESNNDPTIELTSACVLRPGTNKGDHYASVMFRTTVKYRSKRSKTENSVNIIMKTKPEAEGLKKELLEDDTLFAIEIDMYTKTLPEMARMLKEIGEEYKYPRFIYGALKPRAIFILEDISDQGWVMADYITTLDDMKPTVRDIAMFHAASVMIESSDPTFAERYAYAMGEKYMGFEGLIKKSFGDLMQLTVSCSEFAHFAKPLEKFQENLREFYVGLYDPSKTYQNVLIHGDFHYKNMLHKIDDKGRHEDTILLDYQICCWTSPAIDLYYLLDMIPTQEVKDGHRSELIYMYYQQYTDLLKRLGYLGKIPTLLDLQIELLGYAGLELVHYAIFSAIRYMDQSAIDIEAMLKGEVDNPVLNNPEFKKLMHTELTRFLHQGTLSSVYLDDNVVGSMEELAAPEQAWIDRDYFTRVLETYLHADVTVQRYELASGCAGGQNFMSAILRATVHYTLASSEPGRTETVSLIVKTKLTNPELAEETDQLNVFGIEKTVYGPVLKAVRELLTSFGDCTQFAPRFIYEDEHALVLEDLAVKGYRQPDRRARLDLPHMRLIVQKLAKFHAATAVLGRKNRDLFSVLESSSFATEGNPIHLFYANAIQHCIDQTVRVPELSQYSDFLRSFLEHAIEREAKSYEYDRTGFNVLNHGDMWLNNLLWKYDADGTVNDVMMVDYQESFYGSPAFDLNHLLYSSANSAIQRAGFDELVQLYTDELQSALRQFKYDAPLPDLARVRAEMASKRDHALIVTTCIVPPLIVENSELATPENMLGDHEEAIRTREEIFSNPKFIEILSILLPRLMAGTITGCGWVQLTSFTDRFHHQLQLGNNKLIYVHLLTLYIVLAKFFPCQSLGDHAFHNEEHSFFYSGFIMSELSWKTVEYFKDVIVRDLCLEPSDTFTITSFDIGKANEKTAGYMSLIHRVCIEIKFENNHNKSRALSYVVKEKSDTAFGDSLGEVLSVFPKECEVYEKIIPAFEQIFDKRDMVRFGPKVFKTTSEPYNVIIMEDLTRSGFYMREKSFGLPITDVRRILQKLAAFHAASVVYKDRNGKFSELFSEGVIAERTIDILRGHYETLYTVFLQSLRDRNFSDEYLRPLMVLDGRLLQECCKAQHVDSSDFKVLNHGDLWPNNVMFGEDDLRLLDFQTAFYGSFASDLLYFFTTSATELMCDSLEELVQFYYESLLKAFEQLQYRQTIPPYADLLQQLMRRGVLILPPLTEAVAITMGGMTEPSEMEMITSERPEGITLRDRIYNNPSFVTLIDRLLPRLFEIGLLHKSVDSVN
ncbi:uncharacterized protein LOC125764588 [Anopheles funestus]|uniref:uncharacterized protein LOC125764588 n=1 Tax=Anopheles funestus TaxID=62324 RepID=UPI0020C5D1FF|nr:uncharacterized protein LOC125764588 [Anopheles funestus]